MRTDEGRHVAVIGLGYVGLPLACVCAKAGFKVTGYDLSYKVVNELRARRCTVKDPSVEKLFDEVVECGELEFFSDLNSIKECSIYLVCVPTPVDENRDPDLGILTNAIQDIGGFIKKGDLVVIESTIFPGTTEDVIRPMIEKSSGLSAGLDFYLAHCPERVNPGDDFWTSANISRVIGAVGEIGLDYAAEFYSRVLGGPIFNVDEVKSTLRPKFVSEDGVTVSTTHLPLGSVIKMRTVRDAEAVKAMENTVRDVNIAFVNELAKISSALKLDVVDIIDGMSTKPFGKGPFYPGVGVGGHCIAVDPEWLRSASERAGFVPEMIRLARDINNSMPDYVVGLLEKALNDQVIALRNIKVGIVGIAYKKNVADCRESPFYQVRDLLLERGAHLEIYDDWATQENTVNTLAQLLKAVDALIIVTDHSSIVDELSVYDWGKSRIKVVIDGRNCLTASRIAGHITYTGVGR